MSITREQAAAWFETMHPPGPAAREMYRMAAEVLRGKHGKWLLETSKFLPRQSCSACGFNISEFVFDSTNNKTIDLYLFNYCPRCGAKMDQKEDNP